MNNSKNENISNNRLAKLKNFASEIFDIIQESSDMDSEYLNAFNSGNFSKCLQLIARLYGNDLNTSQKQAIKKELESGYLRKHGKNVPKISIFKLFDSDGNLVSFSKKFKRTLKEDFSEIDFNNVLEESLFNFETKYSHKYKHLPKQKKLLDPEDKRGTMSQRASWGNYESNRMHLNRVAKEQRNKNIFYNKSNERENTDNVGKTRIPSIERLKKGKSRIEIISTKDFKDIVDIYNIQNVEDILKGGSKKIGSTGIVLTKNGDIPNSFKLVSKNLVKESVEGIVYHSISEDTFDDEENLFDIFEHDIEISTLQKSSGINILRDKNLSIVAQDSTSGKVVGLLYESYETYYSFDVIVDKAYQNRGIGKDLVDMAFSNYYGNYDYLEMRLEVVNRNLEKYLIAKKNLKVLERHGEFAIMGFEKDGEDDSESINFESILEVNSGGLDDSLVRLFADTMFRNCLKV